MTVLILFIWDLIFKVMLYEMISFSLHFFTLNKMPYTLNLWGPLFWISSV